MVYYGPGPFPQNLGLAALCPMWTRLFKKQREQLHLVCFLISTQNCRLMYMLKRLLGRIAYANVKPNQGSFYQLLTGSKPCAMHFLNA